MALAVNRTGVIFKKCDLSNHKPDINKKIPRLHRLDVIVGQKWRYTTRMTHNDENSPAKR